MTKKDPAEERRNPKVDYLENRCNTLEDKIAEHIDSSNKRVNLLREQVRI